MIFFDQLLEMGFFLVGFGAQPQSAQNPIRPVPGDGRLSMRKAKPFLMTNRPRARLCRPVRPLGRLFL